MQSSQFCMCQRACQRASLSLHFRSSSATFELFAQLVGDLGRIGAELVAIDFELPFLADEDRATHRAVPLLQHEVDLDAVRIAHGHLAVRARR